jgi:hypothetical protein
MSGIKTDDSYTDLLLDLEGFPGAPVAKGVLDARCRKQVSGSLAVSSQ